MKWLNRSMLALLVAAAGAGSTPGCSSTAGGAADAGSEHASDDASDDASDTPGAMDTAGSTGGADAAPDSTGDSGSGGATGDAAGDSAVEHPADTCTQPSDCPGGTCWLGLNGARSCVTAPVSPTLLMCPTGDPNCCLRDSDCTAPADGGQRDNARCLPRTSPCGGAVPIGNTCHFDECRSDVDCQAQRPAGATVAICAPAGALGNINAGCVSGGCRTDADCTKVPGGRCSYALADTGGACSLRYVLFCAYPTDPCMMIASGCSPPTMICVPNDDYQGRRCGKGLPMFP